MILSWDLKSLPRNLGEENFVPLTSRQLAAIFAKGWIKKLFKRAAPHLQILSKRVWPAGREHKLIGRLPNHHKKFSNLKQVKIFSSDQQKLLFPGLHMPIKSEMISGLYGNKTGVMYINTSPQIYTHKVGYTTRPSHIPNLRRKVRGGEGTVSYKSMERNAKIGSAKAFYHEYGHSVNNDFRFSNASDWRRVTASEWRVRAGDTGHSVSMDILGGGKAVPPSESWSESYSLYATSKVSRARLKRERPRSFEYMQRFFERP